MNRNATNILIFALSTTLSFVVAEATLRFLGYESYSSGDNGADMQEYDPALGWRNKEGQYVMARYHPDESETFVTILKGGVRRSSENQDHVKDKRPKTIFIGCSFTQGWAISDQDTYPWKVQTRFPSVEVLNYGTVAYGTYQSLLTLEKVLPFIDRPRLVVYGFIQHHETRNVAPSHWLRLLAWFTPYATLNRNGHLLRHPPERYAPWRLSEKSAVITLAERAFMEMRTMRRHFLKRPVTHQLLLALQKLSNHYGADFIVVILSSTNKTKAKYITFLKSNGILAADCAYPITEEMIVKGEGQHPNGKLNSKWSECIVDFIQSRGLLDPIRK